jgi:hypothetical protein
MCLRIYIYDYINSLVQNTNVIPRDIQNFILGCKNSFPGTKPLTQEIPTYVVLWYHEAFLHFVGSDFGPILGRAVAQDSPGRHQRLPPEAPVHRQ